ncbi:MAG: S-methyl-5-thioribose-1-phosphate isomerase [Deltaproteobacteria bacterium RBG_13_58_19]|nr:MAG: S-methyl-5-thioribose-1-phosphate isomerase [Deltaproteobacteria bacterium RBG_13_58_19]
MIPYCSIYWDKDRVRLLDQRLLPREEVYLEITDYHEVIEAIRTLAIRGAPAIGVAAAMGAALGALSLDTDDPVEFMNRFQEICREIAQARPTAVNLFWALDRVQMVAQAHAGDRVALLKGRLVTEAQTMLKEDETINRRMAQAGQVLIQSGHQVLTHCNTGALATGAYGTALGVMRAAWEDGKRFSVWVDETRPLLQGARLTTWELGKIGIPYTLIPDGAAAAVMQKGRVNLVIVGADRIAGNGDTANKIGTYSLAVLASYHEVPFYVAAPLSTFDFAITDGSHIPVEERSPEEITQIWGQAVAPVGAPALNLAFDVTPHDLISGIITERGIARPPYASSLKLLRQATE